MILKFHPTPGAADGDYAAVEPDVEDVADLSSLPSSDVVNELIHDGLAPPTGWRRDDFPAEVRWYDALSGLHRTACALPTSSQKSGFH